MIWELWRVLKKMLLRVSGSPNILQTIKKEWENIEILRAFKIAVVDDSPLVIDLIREFFLFHGVKRVDYYTNPEEFLEQSMDYGFIPH